MDQTLSYYKIFYTVAKEKNISHAASLLYISQPAISKSIRKLEESLGVTLFLRSSRGVQLTEEGSMLYSYIAKAFETIELGEDQIRKITELGIGHLRIGVSTTLCKYVLLTYLKAFVRQRPHIRITIECQSTNHTLQLLKEGKLDLGLIGKPDALGNLQFLCIGEIEDIFVATRDYINNLSLRNGDQDILQNADLMLLDQENMTRKYIDDYLKEQQIKPNNLLEITTMDLLIEFAKISLGVACVIKEFVLKELEDKILIEIPLGFPIHKREVGFAFPPNARKNNAASEFMEMVIKGM